VYDDRLYKLAFGLPDAADPASVERFDRLYNTVIESFTLLPTTPPPQLAEAAEGARGSAVVVFAKDGDIIVWDETTGESQVIIDSGDMIQVTLSDDGQLVAFVRRIPSEAGGSQQQESAVWVVERSGDDPRELVSTDELRARLGASLTDNTSILCLEWIPNTHRLLYSGSISPPFEGARCFQAGTKVLYLVDVETLAGAELAVPEASEVSFSPSPDGEHIAVGTQGGLYFVNVDDSLSGEVVFTPSGGGMSGCGPFTLRAWTQDSGAVLVRGSLVNEGNFTTRFTIWRVPVDGTLAEPLITFREDRDQLAPDGSVVSFERSTSPGGVYSRFVVPLPEGLGPLAVIPDPFDLSWSPGGSAYNLGWEAMSPLSTYSAQAIEVCEPAIAFGEPVGSLEWLDRNRFLYVTVVPRRLIFASLDGSATLIAEDPPDPLSFAAVASTCRDDAEFVSDVTVPDGTPFAPNTFFQKTWRIRNTGDCAWDGSYRLTYLSGDRMSGPRSAPLGDAVQPGEEVDLSVTLIAPESAGTYQGQWQLFAPDGTPFGTAPYVVIQVP
jgi:WD40 repeat protein